MYNAQRKALIREMLGKSAMVSVNELSELLHISKETVRRDLKDMELERVVKRTHGGAVLIKKNENSNEDPFMIRAIQRHEEKLKLCKKAAEIILDGETVFIDNSSTTIGILQYINPGYQVTVLTNSIRLILESASLNNSNLIIIATGGIFRPSNFSLTGTLADDWVQRFRPNKMFFSCHGIQNDGSMTDGSIYENDVKRSMIRHSHETYLMADHTKFGKYGVVFLSDISDIQNVISTNEIDDQSRKLLDSRRVNAILV